MPSFNLTLKYDLSQFDHIVIDGLVREAMRQPEKSDDILMFVRRMIYSKIKVGRS